MEHWNTAVDGIHNICQAYINDLKGNQHTLEQVKALAYIEIYGSEKHKMQFVDKLVDCLRQPKANNNEALPKKKNKTKKSSPKKARIFNAIMDLEAYSPKFTTFKKTFSRVINSIFAASVDNGFSLDICRSHENEKENDYAICDEDIFFLVFLFATYTSKDAQNLLNGHYNEISEEYADYIKSGIMTFVSNHKSDTYTEDYVKDILDLEFGYYQKKLQKMYDELGHIVFEVTNFNYGDCKSKEQWLQCITVLENYEDAFMKLRNDLLPSLRKEEIAELEQMVEEHRRQKAEEYEAKLQQAKTE